MSFSDSQTFLRELDKKLWTSADNRGAQASRLFLQDGKATADEKARGKMPVLHYKITSTGKLIDDALEAVEKENPKLKNVLNKNYTQLQIDPANLAGLIDLIATIPFPHADRNSSRHSRATTDAKDTLGHVYEYFLGQFALAEGKKGGQYFTPKSIVSLIVEMIESYQGCDYDPAMGSGGYSVIDSRPSCM